MWNEYFITYLLVILLLLMHFNVISKTVPILIYKYLVSNNIDITVFCWCFCGIIKVIWIKPKPEKSQNI